MTGSADSARPRPGRQ